MLEASSLPSTTAGRDRLLRRPGWRTAYAANTIRTGDIVDNEVFTTDVRDDHARLRDSSNMTSAGLSAYVRGRQRHPQRRGRRRDRCRRLRGAIGAVLSNTA